MAKKTIKEAGNYDNLTAQEKQLLASAAPEIRNSLATVVSSLRKKGKQIDLAMAAQQMQQVPHFANDPNLKKFASLAGLQNLKPQQNPFQQPNANVPKPFQFNNQAQQQQRANLIPKTQPNAPADQFEQMRQNPNMSNDDVIAQQKAQTSQSSFDRAKQLRSQRDARMQQPGMAAPVNPLGATQPVQAMQQKKRHVAEAMNPAMMTSSLRNILGAISKLKPDELSAIAGMVNNLMASKKGSMGMGTTMESKKIVTEAIKVKLVEQIKARNTATKLISEGPMASIWDKIKGAGSAIGGQMGLAGQMGQQAQAVGVDENAKRASQEMTKMLGKVNQHRQKFNSSILKNSEAMNSYHDLVLNAVQMYQQTQNMLGPFGQQIVRQIHDAVGNLVYDLKSEQEQIDSFLKQLKDAGMAKVGGNAMTKPQATMDPTMLGAAAKKKAQASRVEENPGGGASMRRSMPMGGGKMDPKFGDDLEKSQALAKAKMGNSFGDIGTTQNAMNDLQKLFMKQIQRDKGKKKSTKKTGKK